jgi:hypothetical protein
MASTFSEIKYLKRPPTLQKVHLTYNSKGTNPQRDSVDRQSFEKLLQEGNLRRVQFELAHYLHSV